MGGSSVTTGWNYKLAWHDQLCKGPLDAFIEFRGADKVVWKGRLTASGAVVAYKPQLWGGDKDQGGVDGTLRVMFGSAGQMPNAYLTSVFGPKTAAWRGIATVAYEGGTWGANNPYAQKRSYRVERIVKGWDGDDCWYPAKAPVPLVPMTSPGGPGVPDAYLYNVGQRVTADAAIAGPGECTQALAEQYGFAFTPENEAYWFWRPIDFEFGFIKLYGESNIGAALELIEMGWQVGQTAIIKYISGEIGPAILTTEDVMPPAPPGYSWGGGGGGSGEWGPFESPLGTLYLWASGFVKGANNPSAPGGGGRMAKNPAHMILYAHTQNWAGRMPRDSVNLEHLTAQADWFYERGFGLCTRRKPKEESPREFIRRIEKVAGCSFTQSFDDGLWYLDIANGVYVLDDLPIITDDDILSFKETSTVLDDAVNSVSVQYFDPERKEKIITPPTRAMGLIAQYGEIHQTFEYPEIPIGRIALEVATRELLASITPTRAFELDVMPWLAKLRRNQYVRLQLPKRGISDMVCLVAEVKNGKLKSGAVQLKLAQDIYSLPSTVYTDIELGEDPRPPSEPIQIDQKAIFEAPFIDVVAAMPAADFAALPEGAGYVLAAASNPGRMRNFTMLVAPDGGTYAEVDEGEFCPSCTLTGEIAPGLQTSIGYTNGRNMAAVPVGTLGVINGELVRVDAHDAGAMTLNLGRGCGDTLPHKHAAGSAILFYQVANGYDRTQHVADETVQVKLLTNSFVQQMAQAAAPATEVTFAERIARPYPPGDLKVGGVSIYEVGTSTPGGGGGGGGGGGSGGPTSPPGLTSYGTPASTTPGPNGGFADDGVNPVPVPTVFDDDIMTGGDFTDPDEIDRWKTMSGEPLTGWSIVDGQARYYGRTTSAMHGIADYVASAYLYDMRLLMPPAPIPRYELTMTATVRCDPTAKVAIGVAWGVGPAYYPAYQAVSEGQTCITPTTISFTYAVPPMDSIPLPGTPLPQRAVMPVLTALSGNTWDSVEAWFDDLTLEFTEIPTPSTPVSLDHLDFDAGLTGWTLLADPTGNPYAPTINVAGGEAAVSTTSMYFRSITFVCDDPITSADAIGKYIGVTAEVWSNDPTVIQGVAYSGVILCIASKIPGQPYNVRWVSPVSRGDWTTREGWGEVILDDTIAPGVTWHVGVLFWSHGPGYTSKVRNLQVRVTDEVID